MQYNVGVWHEIVREVAQRADRLWLQLQEALLAGLQDACLVGAGLGATAEIVAQVVFADYLQDVATAGLFGKNAVKHFLSLVLLYAINWNNCGRE